MATLITTTVNHDDPAFLYLTLHPNEKIQAVVRRHWAGFISTIALTLGMAIVPLVLYFSGRIFFVHDFAVVRPILVLMVSSFYLFLLTFLFGAWINYYYHIIFITSERVINVVHKGLFAREVSDLGLAQIEDVTAQVEGFLPTLLNYGLLIIETAGEGTSDILPGVEGYFTISDVPDPNRLARMVIELHRQSDNQPDS